jgi:hypothetical protein
MATSLEQMVSKQIDKVLTRGQRFERFDQLRQRHFWSSYLFAPGAGNIIQAGPYDIFRVIPSMSGQGYPAGISLTERETNWRGAGRVPDNQNFVIQEIGVSIVRPPPVDGDGAAGVPANPPSNGIWNALSPAIQALVAQSRTTSPLDAEALLYGATLEMGFLTNNVPLGLLSDFSQSGGIYAQVQPVSLTPVGAAGIDSDNDNDYGDPSNGVPAAAFRRKLEVPILLQHGEAMGMRINLHRPITLATLSNGGAGWVEVRVDWWASESFVEYS